MRAALLIVLSLSALAFAGPTAFNKNTNNQIDAKSQQDKYMTATGADSQLKQTQAIETLKQWCFSSQMSQPELTASFKKLVGIVKSSPVDESTESAVMNERICQGALVQKSTTSGETIANNGADAQAHELIKDVYMDALIACEQRECKQQLMKLINQSNKVDPIRASYYMTRIAVTEKETIKDESEVKQWAEQLTQQQPRADSSEAIERQKLFATTSIIGKFMKNKCDRNDQITGELKQTAEQVVKTIIERYIRPVSQQEVQQYQQQHPTQQNKEVAKKIAKRNAALKALANIPGCVLSEIQEVEQVLIELAQNKQELVTVRQSAIECLQHNDKVFRQLKQVAFDQEEPIEVRIAALRTLMTAVWAGKQQAEQTKQQLATEIVDQLVKHCEIERNQQQDDQFVLYAISYLDNLRTSQKPEHQAIKECISKNKQHYMQIQLLCKKFKQQLNDVRRSSRNYKLEQEFNQIESGLVLEGDLIYESKQKQSQQYQILPKLVRVNMSMPIMGETVNVIEVTVRQHQMDEELLGALKLVKDAKFNSESVSKVVDSFKSSVEKQQQQQPRRQGQSQQNAEADLTIKVDGCTVVYVCVDDFKTETSHHQRNTRSVHYSSFVYELIEHIKRNPIAFNRGFNFNFNERLAKALDVDANIIAGLRFESRASGSLNKDVEIVAKIEPRFAFEAIVGPAKMTNKKLLQRLSTKTALGLRLRYKQDELVDFQIDLPMNTMELFTFETQLVEKSSTTPYSYTYLPESIYGQENIYSPDEEYVRQQEKFLDDAEDSSPIYRTKAMRKMKRSIFENQSKSSKMVSFFQGKQRQVAYSLETPEQVARMTGLRGKIRVVASPKDMSFLVQAICQKYEPSMQGVRVQIQKVSRGMEQKQVVFTISTPGSRIERTIQWRAIVQQNKQRTLIKSDIQTPKKTGTMQIELIHDGRQFAIKAEMVEQSKYRHSFECGVLRASQSQSGRIASSYKPYLSIDSSYLKRPVQMQGVVSYQQQPKTVISWELKCPTSGDFIQGKWIVDSKQSSYNMKRSTLPIRRSMRSPIVELVFNKDFTVTGEMVAQISQHAVKLHQMIDWDSDKMSLNADLSASHKDLKKSTYNNEFIAQCKLNKDLQMVTVQRKCPQQARKEYRFEIISKKPIGSSQHEMLAEIRYNGKRSSNAVVAYKHKIDLNEFTSRKAQLNYYVEVLATELNLNEKYTGRTELVFERNLKVIRNECRSNNKLAKLEVEFESLMKHHIECQIQTDRYTHKTLVRANERQFQCQSRTDKQGSLLAKIELDVQKHNGDCQVLIEMPHQQVHIAADLKLNSGKLSSWAIQTPRFASKAELTFEIMNNKRFFGNQFWKQPSFKNMIPFNTLRFKTDLKDSLRQENYWMDSAYNTEVDNKSYFRFDSPIYHSDVQFEPRDATTKFNLFARSKRSIGKQMYSQEDSMLDQLFDYSPLKQAQQKLNLGQDKLWMIRSIVSPRSVDELKRMARRALFEYADRRQQHKHQINWSPMEERVNFAFEHQPNTDYYSSLSNQWSPMRFAGDFSTNFFDKAYTGGKRPSTFSMESELIDFDIDASPFDGDSSYAKLNVLSRNPRSAFKKHESEYKYNKKHGYKASMKHLDRDEKQHSWQLEADESPKKFAKMSLDSPKYGKHHYEHNWRKYVNKRSPLNKQHEQLDQEDCYSNKLSLSSESPRKHWSHKTDLSWDEPINFQRTRRDVSSVYDSAIVASDNQRRYNTYDYLKHVSARLNSQVAKNNELYNVDFDYKPYSHARLNLQMPNELLHETSFEYQPTERLYKVQSKLMNKNAEKPYYELLGQTKPVIGGLATADQEPVFFNDQHPMLTYRPNQLVSSLFKQPLKLDYTDKYGRVARFDYDLSPLDVTAKYAGLRQKRAAVYYKDDSRDFEHDSSFDFYPEQLLARGFNKHQRQQYQSQANQMMAGHSGDFVTKFQTKYGPIVMRCDTTGKTVEIFVESPAMNAKITSESSAMKRGEAKLIKIQLDNKNQKVQLSKMLRNTILAEFEPIVKLAHKLDSGRFEHQTELLVSLVEAIFKLKSQTYKNERPIMMIDGEFNKQSEKLLVKIEGERVKGQLVCDFASGLIDLVLNKDGQRVLQHQTRLSRENERFYHLESMTSYKQQPLYKLSGRVSAMVFEEPMHLFQRRHQYNSADEHISYFDATIYQPRVIVVKGKYDCIKKEANFDFQNQEEKLHQQTMIKYDELTKSIFVNARLSSPSMSYNNGQVYTFTSKLALPGLVSPVNCQRRYNEQSCQSEMVYTSAKQGFWSARYVPNDYVHVQTPYGQQRVNLAY